jgi:hypothetical protein
VSRQLHAVTLHQPWATSIARGWRPLENRTWPPPPQLMGRHLAIHAGKSFDQLGLQDLARDQARLGIPDGELNSSMPVSAIIAVARLAGAVLVVDAAHPDVEQLGGLPLDGARIRATKVLGGLPAQRALDATRSPWARGPWLWVLEEVVAIEPVPCSGAQKVWRVPPAVADQVLERFNHPTRRTAP